MKAGKLPESHLRRSVLKKLNKRNFSVDSRPDVGMDAAMLKGQFITAQAVVDLPVKHPMRLAVIKAVNNLAAGGGRLLGVSLTVLMPVSANESSVRALIEEAERQVALYEGAEILGGDVRLSYSVNVPVITVTAIGDTPWGQGQQSLYTIKADMDIVMTKWIAMEATYLLAENQYDVLHERFSGIYIDGGLEFGGYLSVVPEAEVLHDMGIHSMHDVSTGGVFAALWELLAPSGLGCQVALGKIPAMQESIEFAEFYNLNPYMLTGAGSLLAVVPEGRIVVNALAEAGIHAAVIGKTTKDKARAVYTQVSVEEEWADPAKPRRRHEVEQRFLVPPKSDEIYQILGNVNQ